MAPLLTELSINVCPSSVWLFLPSNFPTLHLFLTHPHTPMYAHRVPSKPVPRAAGGREEGPLPLQATR